MLERHASCPVGAIEPSSVDALVEEVRNWSDLVAGLPLDARVEIELIAAQPTAAA